MKSARILIVEDDRDVRTLVKKHLLDEECEVDEAEDGVSGTEKAIRQTYDLVILDLNLPKRDGLEVCRLIRAHDGQIPILMLTAKMEEIDRVLGLELGADDYLTKPFSVRELLARIKAILRRVGMQQERQKSSARVSGSGSIEARGISIDLARRTVSRDGTPLSISNMEFELLLFLIERRGTAFSREEILEQVWGYTAVEYAQNISTHVNRLRRKLEPNPELPTYILTVRGFGYMFAE